MKGLKYTTQEMIERFITRQGSIVEAIAEANCKRRMQIFESEGYKKWAEIEDALILINK
tara:strand:- start:1894 stop:2070 length:177 start_codon:yes stop_codon:yes gene_type:complete